MSIKQGSHIKLGNIIIAVNPYMPIDYSLGWIIIINPHIRVWLENVEFVGFKVENLSSISLTH